MRNFTKSAMVIGILALLAGVTGCGGSDRGDVSGTVTLDGTPIDNGTIVFVPEGGGGVDAHPKAGAKIIDGKYLFEPGFGPYPGKYKVEVTWDKKTGKKVSTGDADTRDETKQMLPAKFNTATTLTAEIASGKSTKDFQLLSK